MRPFIITPQKKQAIRELVSFAAKKENWFSETATWSPGDRPSYVIELDTFRVVFTYSKIGFMVYRHISISVPGKGNYPNPYVAYTISHLFGFTGGRVEDEDFVTAPGPNWQMRIDKQHQCIEFIQDTGIRC